MSAISRKTAGAALALALIGAPLIAQETAEGETASAIFAGGCFWCVESDFDKVDGVLDTVSGYSGGTVDEPTYEQVVAGGTGHREVLQVTYDPSVVSYERLVEILYRTIDPLDAGGQFCDRGFSYSPAIYVADAEERETVEAVRARVDAELGEETVVAVEDASAFWPAEEYHQNYYAENPIRYGFYRTTCGRDRRVEAVWGESPKDAVERLGAGM
jgi:peptide-methionine (S)-S-oxide reductase